MVLSPGLKVIGPAMGFKSDVFEIESKHVGCRFEVSVTSPPDHVWGEKKLPVLYATDTHTNIASMIAATLQLLGSPTLPKSIRPFVLVCIGYSGEQAGSTTLLRSRELTPTGEPIPELMEEHVRHPRYGFSDGERELLLYNTRNGRAGDFLNFLEEELHYEIVRRYDTIAESAGFFGHSNGGLFALYTLIAGNGLFNRICAASPAILTDQSKILLGYREIAERQRLKAKVDLFVTLAEHEILGDYPLYRRIGIGTLRFIDLVKTFPLPGLTLSSSVISGEDHASVVFEAFKRFIVSSYSQTLVSDFQTSKMTTRSRNFC